jgi:hypothetical protein
MTYFDPTIWRAFTREEMLNYLEHKKRKRRGSKRGGLLVLQKSVSPFDAYTYFHARFGHPNGLQTMLARDDSDNLYHWDYNIKAGTKDLIVTGATQEVHVWFQDDLSDPKFLKFILSLKADFARVGKEKSKFAATLEKWDIFPNQYLSIANRCAELYDSISTALPNVNRLILENMFGAKELRSPRKVKALSKLMTQITTAPTELSVLMPVMFEAFIGLLVAGLTKPEIKENQRMFDAFVRSPLDVKIMDLANRCRGFQRSIEQNNRIFSRFRSIVNKRNDIIHGNIDPVKNSLEVVYFHGKRPLYKNGGDRIRQHWIGLVNQYQPQEVLDDYVAMNEFVIEILDHLEPSVRGSLLMVMEDTQPGWDDKRQIFGRLFPDHIATTYMEGLRYDWELSDN